MDILLFEPQLASFAGHYNRYVRVLAAEAARRGLQLGVATSRHIQADVQTMLKGYGACVLPVFEAMPYRMLPDTAARDSLSRQVADAALSCLKDHPLAHPAWLSGTGALLGAACQFADAARRRVVFQMLDFARDWPAGAMSAPAPLRQAVARAQDFGMQIFAQSACVARHLQGEIGVPVNLFPAILDLHPLQPRRRRARPVMGLTNMMRGGKNLAQALDAMLSHGDDLSILLHTGQGTTDEKLQQLTAYVYNLVRLHRLQKPQVKIIPGILSAADYVKMWQTLDCTLLPYDRTRYVRQGSGILFESIADAIIPIVPKGTAMATTLATYGVGLSYDADAPRSLHRAVDHTLENFDNLADRSHAVAPIFRDRNAPAKIVDIIMGEGRK